ncbi:uncharacterized protein LOC116742273 [Phocoena sinus]|uniref:uncharacterized protein LOC116742272 n=1 Tax=Phocoena sinus TaxID=42100 RepID=UPI0013C47CD0|nr:uncharacterized protein LOC116742272 [Phocoena sinus]XP_032465489.1 uncharacterized protein LOC116742273 [Phocoena sinus]
MGYSSESGSEKAPPQQSSVVTARGKKEDICTASMASGFGVTAEKRPFGEGLESWQDHHVLRTAHMGEQVTIETAFCMHKGNHPTSNYEEEDWSKQRTKSGPQLARAELTCKAASSLSSGVFLENWKKFSTRSEQGVICCGAPCDGFPASPHTTHRSTGARVATWVAAQAEPGQHDGCKRQGDSASGQPPHQQVLTRRVKQVVGHTHLGRDEGHVLDASLGEISTQQELHFPAPRVYGHSELAEMTEALRGFHVSGELQSVEPLGQGSQTSVLFSALPPQTGVLLHLAPLLLLCSLSLNPTKYNYFMQTCSSFVNHSILQLMLSLMILCFSENSIPPCSGRLPCRRPVSPAAPTGA